MTGVVTSTNAVLIKGDPLIEELICKTVTGCTPGVLVQRDTDDTHFKVNTAAGKPAGWLNLSYKKGIGDTYETNQAAEILTGAIFVRALTDASGNITKNDILIADADGKVKKANDDASMNATFPVGRAGETKTYTGSTLAIAVKSEL